MPGPTEEEEHCRAAEMPDGDLVQRAAWKIQQPELRQLFCKIQQAS
jgi:hypothetical protein